MLGMGYVILLWHSLSLPYNYLPLGKSTVSVHYFDVKLSTLGQ